MNKPIVLISDIHGMWNTLQALLAKVTSTIGADYQVYLAGDLIDRGPRSKEVVEWAMENNIPCVSGNHEDLALAFSRHTKRGYKAKCTSYYDPDVWLFNGGEDTMESWGCDIPQKVLDWMAQLPPYIILDQESDGRKLLLSHTGYGLDADKNNWIRALWGRYDGDGPFVYESGTGDVVDDGYFRVFGHTQHKKPIITDTHANIDTGAAYGARGMGTLTAMVWPTKQLISQKAIG